MKRAIFKSADPEDWHSLDVSRLVRAAEAAGIEISSIDAKLAWEAYSNSMAAGWMMLDDDDKHNLANMMPYLEIKDE